MDVNSTDFDIEVGIKVFDRKQELRSHKGYWALRRGQDVFFSGLAMVVLSPVLLLTALAVLIDDPHDNPIFIQLHCGRDGKKFYMYIFLSMYMDAEK